MTDGEIIGAYLSGGPLDEQCRRMPKSSVEAGYIATIASFADAYTVPGEEPKPHDPSAYGKYIRTEKTLEVWEWEGSE